MGGWIEDTHVGRAAGLAALSLSTETKQWLQAAEEFPAPLGPGPSCTHSRPSTARRGPAPSPLPAEGLRSSPGSGDQHPAGSGPPLHLRANLS